MNTRPGADGAPTRARALAIIVVLCFSSMCAALMQSLVIPIQSELPELLSTSPGTASWVVTATLLGGGVAMPVSGRLADLYGRKPVLVASSIVLLAGSLICATSSSVALMLVGRVLQGIAMGYIPVAISLVRDAAPPHLKHASVAGVSATLGVGGALGLPLAAWVAQTSDWHLLFWISAALAVAMAVLTAAVVPHTRHDARGRLDVIGTIGLAIGLVSLLVGISKGNEWGWASLNTVGLISLGVVVLLVWGWLELRQPNPLVDLRTSARRPVLLTNIAALLIGFGMMAQSIVVPQLLNMPESVGGLGQSILMAGIWMAPGGLMMMLFTPVSSRLLTRLGGRTTLAIGAGVIAAGYLVATLLMDAPWQLMISSCVISAGVGIGYAAMPTLILDNVPRAEASAGVGLNSLMRSVGTTVAGAVMAVVLTANTIVPVAGAPEVPSHDAFRLCFVIGAVAAAVAAVIVLGIARREPEPMESTAAAEAAPALN